jgi:hypothetical protein
MTAAAIDDIAAIRRFHSFAKAMYSFAATLAWLVGTFHVITFTVCFMIE